MTKRKPRTRKTDLVQLATAEDRLRLPPRKAPYFIAVRKGLSLGLYVGTTGSVWKWRLEKPRREEILGAPEEEEQRTELPVLSYEEAVSQAKQRAKDYLDRARKEGLGGLLPTSSATIPLQPTVADALRDYLTNLETRQVEAKGTARSRIEKIIREIGRIKLRDLVPKDLNDWMAVLVTTPPQRRAKKGCGPNFAKNFDVNEPINKLRRQCTANRSLGDLKAALNRAYENRWVTSDQGWRGVKAFPDCTGSREQVLDASQQSDFLNGCTPEFRPLAYSTLLTASRYGPMTKWRVKDFHPLDRAIRVGWDKRHQRDRLAPLTNEAIAVFHHICRDRDPEEFMFVKANGLPWGRNHQARPMGESADLMNIDVCFYNLRHTAITMWLLNGVDIATVATAVGTSSQMIEKHYKNPRVTSLAANLQEKVPQVGSFDDEIEEITRGYDAKRLERLQARKQLNFALRDLHPSSYAGKILGGTQAPLPPKPKPTTEELAELLQTTPLFKIGARYGVSGHTVKTWALKADLPVPGRGAWAKLRHEARLEGAEEPGEALERLPKPTPEELAKLLGTMPATDIAKRYGVVGPTVLRWAAEWELPRPGRGAWAKRGGEAYRQEKIAKKRTGLKGELT